jgi:hypothetical protein
LALFKACYQAANYTAPAIFGHFCDSFSPLWGLLEDSSGAQLIAPCGKRRGGILANMVQVALLVQNTSKSR